MDPTNAGNSAKLKLIEAMILYAVHENIISNDTKAINEYYKLDKKFVADKAVLVESIQKIMKSIKIPNAGTELDAAKKELDAAKTKLDAAKTELDAAEKKYLIASLNYAKKELDAAKKELDAAKNKLDDPQSNDANKKKTYDTARKTHTEVEETHRIIQNLVRKFDIITGIETKKKADAAAAAASAAQVDAPAAAEAAAAVHKTEIAVILPFLLQTYESLYEDKNYSGTTTLDDVFKTKVPNREIMEVVIREITRIQQRHPHPQLFETIFYFWNIFNLQTALSIMMAYLKAIPDGEEPPRHPGDIITVIEKRLGNVESFNEWDTTIPKTRKFNIYTRIVGENYSPIAHADSTLIALTRYPFQAYNPTVSTQAFNNIIDPTTGQFIESARVIKNNIYNLDLTNRKGGRRKSKSRVVNGKLRRTTFSKPEGRQVSSYSYGFASGVFRKSRKNSRFSRVENLRRRSRSKLSKSRTKSRTKIGIRGRRSFHENIEER